jgi:hypothetical protein
VNFVCGIPDILYYLNFLSKTFQFKNLCIIIITIENYLDIFDINNLKSLVSDDLGDYGKKELPKLANFFNMDKSLS